MTDYYDKCECEPITFGEVGSVKDSHRIGCTKEMIINKTL